MLRMTLSLTLALWVGANLAFAQDKVKGASKSKPTASVGEKKPPPPTPAKKQVRRLLSAAEGPAVKKREQVRLLRADARKVQERKTIVCRLRNNPAVDMAQVINEFLRSERAVAQPPKLDGSPVIMPEAIINSLIISATPHRLDEITELVEKLDRPSAMVRLEVLLVEVSLADEANKEAGELVLKASAKSVDAAITELKKRGELTVLARPQILTLDNQSAFIQIGQRLPRITGASVSSRGRANSVTLENVGLTLGVTSRINAEQRLVTMEIDFEKSHLGPDKEGVPLTTSPTGEEVRSPRIDTLTAQTTVKGRSGQSLILGGLVHKSEFGWRELLIVVTPHIVTAEDD